MRSPDSRVGVEESQPRASNASMTIQRFQGLVLILSNQTFVRHYLCLNYPNEPPIMGIQFTEAVSPKLAKELESRGFSWSIRWGMWVIERSPDIEVNHTRAAETAGPCTT